MSWFKKQKAPSASAPVMTAPNGSSHVCISDLLCQGTIKVNLESQDKEEAIEELVELLVRSGGVKDREAAVRAIHAREAMGSTGIGGGVAIPHGKDASIETLVAALGISKRGVEFDAIDGKPARMLVLLLARSDNPGPHIQALSEIAQLVAAPKFLDRVYSARSEQEVLDIIRQEEKE